MNYTGTRASYKIKGESKGSHKAETKGDGGDLHQAKKGTDCAILKLTLRPSSQSCNWVETSNGVGEN